MVLRPQPSARLMNALVPGLLVTALLVAGCSSRPVSSNGGMAPTLNASGEAEAPATTLPPADNDEEEEAAFEALPETGDEETPPDEDANAPALVIKGAPPPDVAETPAPEPEVAPEPPPVTRGSLLAASTPNRPEPVSPSRDHTRQCEKHFIGKAMRAACTHGGQARKEEKVQATVPRCQKIYPDTPRERMACFTGAGLQDALLRKGSETEHHLKLCQKLYPAHNTLDLHLQESCVAGLKLPSLTGEKPSLAMCERYAGDSALAGPCAAGLSFADRPDTEAEAHNRVCKQYFDHKVFHMGYRSCLNARGLALAQPSSPNEVLRGCDNVTADPQNETEKAACLVGVSLYHHAIKSQQTPPRFTSCGTNTLISYQERNTLICLAAASLMDHTDKGKARRACATVFNKRRSKNRQICERSINLF